MSTKHVGSELQALICAQAACYDMVAGSVALIDS